VKFYQYIRILLIKIRLIILIGCIDLRKVTVKQKSQPA